MTTEDEATPFRHLPLGARFKYVGRNDVWVVLQTHGCGLVAAWKGNILQFVGQSICCAEETEAATDNLRVILLPDNAVAQQEPVQREWVGLTRDERIDLDYEFENRYDLDFETDWLYERAIEAKLKAKNAHEYLSHRTWSDGRPLPPPSRVKMEWQE